MTEINFDVQTVVFLHVRGVNGSLSASPRLREKYMRGPAGLKHFWQEALMLVIAFDETEVRDSSVTP